MKKTKSPKLTVEEVKEKILKIIDSFPEPRSEVDREIMLDMILTEEMHNGMDFFLTGLLKRVKNGTYTKGKKLFPEYIRKKEQGKQPSLDEQKHVIQKINESPERFFDSRKVFQKTYENIYGKHRHEPTELKKVISTNPEKDYQKYLQLKNEFNKYKNNGDQKNFFSDLLNVEYQEFLIFCFEKLYERQTDEEKEKETTEEKNYIGFNITDAEILITLFKNFKKEQTINPNEGLDLYETSELKKRIPKYHGQILEIPNILEIYADFMLPRWKEGIEKKYKNAPKKITLTC